MTGKEVANMHRTPAFLLQLLDGKDVSVASRDLDRVAHGVNNRAGCQARRVVRDMRASQNQALALDERAGMRPRIQSAHPIVDGARRE